MEWIETPANKFGFKCMQERHDKCKDDWCQCVCHTNKPPVMEAIQ